MQLDGGRELEDGTLREDSTIIDLDSIALACKHQNLCPIAVTKGKRISVVSAYLQRFQARCYVIERTTKDTNLTESRAHRMPSAY